MNSRERILKAARLNQAIPKEEDIQLIFQQEFKDLTTEFKSSLLAVGGNFQEITPGQEMTQVIQASFPGAKRTEYSNSVTSAYLNKETPKPLSQPFSNIDVFVMSSKLGIAENGAIWITDKELQERILPFAAINLIVILQKKDIVSTMHDAYKIIGTADYDFATFISGPSKTADIEQSLVLGAHGPKSLTVILS